MSFKIERDAIYLIQEVYENLAKLGIEKETTDKLIEGKKISKVKVGNREFITGKALLKYFEIGDIESYVVWCLK